MKTLWTATLYAANVPNGPLCALFGGIAGYCIGVLMEERHA